MVEKCNDEYLKFDLEYQQVGCDKFDATQRVASMSHWDGNKCSFLGFVIWHIGFSHLNKYTFHHLNNTPGGIEFAISFISPLYVPFLAHFVSFHAVDYISYFTLFSLPIPQIVVLQTKTAKAATLDILATHCIPSAMSDDLKAWDRSNLRLGYIYLFLHFWDSSQ